MKLNIYFQIISLMFIVLIAVVFFNKQKKDSIVNRIYRNLVVVSLPGPIIDIASIISSLINPSSSISIFLCKTYLLYLLVASFVFFEYVCLVIKEKTTNEEEKTRYKNTHRNFMLLITITAAVLYSLPIEINIHDYLMYTSGPCAMFSYMVGGGCIISWIIILISKHKYLNMKKALPIICAIFFQGLAAILQFVFPNLLLVTAGQIFLVVSMYFTIFQIENPDLKLIEEINQAKEEADRANNSKSEFLANMSHEIRTPLNAILGFSQSLLEENIPDNVRSDIEDIVSSSDTLLEIVNEILDISKMESNKLEVLNVEYPSDKIYKYLVTLAEERIGSRQLEFIHSCDTKLPPVLFGDYVKIRQIAINLLTNAIKYTEEGFVKFKIECKILNKDECCVTLIVQDSGIGIKEENIEKIFAKYECEDNEHNVIEGTGLGLALTKRLVNLMGGKMKITSTLGEGSTFSVSLNQKIVHKTREQVEAENPNLSRTTFIGHGEKILIVDDNTVNLKVACRLLKYYNLKIDLATCGKECIKKAMENEYDLVMLDDMMPEMNGYETLLELKKIRGYHTPTVALTANAVSGMKEKYIDQGFDDYLAKPIDKILLEDILHKFLNKKPSKSKKKKEKDSNMEEKNNDNINKITSIIEQSVPITSSQSNEEQKLENETKISEENILEKSSDNVSKTSGNEKGNEEYLKSNGVDLNAALELLGDMEMYNDTVNDFVAEIDNKMADIQKFYDAKDMPNYAILVHSLKSDSKYIGLMHLAELAYNHEMASKANDVEFVTNNYEELIQEANKMISVIKKYSGV